MKDIKEKLGQKGLKIVGVASVGAVIVIGVILLIVLSEPTHVDVGRTGTVRDIEQDDEWGEGPDDEEEQYLTAGWSVFKDEYGNLYAHDPDGNRRDDVEIRIDENGIISIYDLDGNKLAEMPDDIIRIRTPGLEALLPTAAPTNPDGSIATPPPAVTDGNGDIVTTRPPGTGRGTGTGDNPSDEPPSQGPITITLNGNSVKTDENGDTRVRIRDRDNRIEIRRPGEYIITGTLYNGFVVVDTNRSDGSGREGVVNITLRNAKITNPDGPAIRSTRNDAGGTLTVTLAPGTVNNLTDSREGRPEEDDEVDDGGGEEDAPPRRDAALFSHIPLTITGSGTLEVVGGFAHGIHSRNILSVSGGANIVVVDAHVHGLRSRYEMFINNSNIDVVNASSRGLRAAGNNNGRIMITNSEVKVRSYRDGIYASNNLNITNSKVDVVVDRGFGVGRPSDEYSKRGLRAKGNITLNGGTFKIDSVAGAVGAGRDVTITNVKMETRSGGSAIRGRPNITIRNSNIDVRIANHGLTAGWRTEAGAVTLSGNTITVHARSSNLNTEHKPNTAPARDNMPSFTNCPSGCTANHSLRN
jgi:hypothetical protein